ncbi:hypothetical protein IJS18_02825 [Candidatus Saccharibacteria bacterium]|nr:hypothetical protein [Candidatus Saccharibacteria bacterium]
MHESTFPFWLIALFIGGFFSYWVGYLDPKVSKKTKEDLKSNPDGTYLAIIENRFKSETAICIAVGIAITVLIFFFCDGFSSLITKTGGTILSVVLAIFVVLVLFVFTAGIIVFVFLIGATVSSLRIERKLKERYRGISVDYDIEDVLDDDEVPREFRNKL